MQPKVIAFYLPQFHRIPENDKWWGKGFTDWVSSKNARPLFPGHNQPRIPAHENYYNLLDKETICWQAELARKAGVYGFCIYHYWFGNHKQLLEKPAENLLQWKDIDINYCFSWVNESWIYSWSKYKGGAWLYTNVKGNAETQGLLVKQEYGDENEWKRHFEYLLPFFKDDRYIKKDNKPVFVIYKPENMKHIRKMVQLWNQLAQEQGFAGIYFIGTNDTRWKTRNMDAGMIYEPGYSLHENADHIAYAKKMNDVLKKINIESPRIYLYDNFWKRILSRQSKKGMYYGGLVDFDNTPRRGKLGYVVWGMTPYKFGKYFRCLYQKAVDRGDEYIFLNAWNEWGEGAYLEPDTKYGVRCLQEFRRGLDDAGQPV